MNCVQGIDGGLDVDPCLLMDIYERIKKSEFQPGEDHVTQVMRVEQMLVGKKPVFKGILRLNNCKVTFHCTYLNVPSSFIFFMFIHITYLFCLCTL